MPFISRYKLSYSTPFGLDVKSISIGSSPGGEGFF
jgi:hypothetical protein